jgi:hypothetical protein
VVKEGVEENLELSEAQELLSSLKNQMQTGENIRLSIRWIVEGE